MNNKRSGGKHDLLPFDPEKRILDYPLPMDHARMLQYLSCYAERYPFLKIESIGSSLLQRDIPAISLGEGEKTVVYIGAQHGSDWLSCVLLLRLVNEYAEGYRTGKHIYSTYLPYLFHRRRILLIPMLNPDGVDYCINGITNEQQLYPQINAKAHALPSHTQWHGNARGIDLYHNYDAHFHDYRAYAAVQSQRADQQCASTPESEPEVAYLCNYLRFYKQHIGAVISLGGDGEQLLYDARATEIPACLSVGKIIARLCGTTLTPLDAQNANATLLCWCHEQIKAPAYHLCYEKKEKKTALEYYFCLYAAIRQMLFEAPQLI